MKPYIRENAMASIGTDGLMGNKLLNINSVPGDARPVEQGSVIQSQKPIETDEMLRTLNTTNNNLERISYNLKEVTVKLNNSKSLWNLLSDTLITLDLRNAVRDFRRSGSNLAEVTQTTKNIVSRFDRGDGLAGALFTDSTLTQSLAASLANIQQASDKASHMVENLETVIAQLKSGEGTAGLLLSDTTLRNALLRSGENVEEGTARFNQNMEALKTNFFFKGYFKKLEKEERKSNTNQQ
jgi:phospholipid/cholesterol/gamma-HCH transport system substrate-binding protein